jgi:ubiquinone/menaquinone biosynthesis C-methylase UbiE
MNKWDEFFKEKIIKIFQEKREILDIGGGRRVDAGKGNRYDKKNAWLVDYIKKSNYKILDKLADYKPDIVGDIHNLPLPDASVDAVICIAVLEHVEEPLQAIKEIYRVLKPGGFCYIYVPFLYYYHPMKGYYQDFYRFTYDGVKYLVKDFKQVEIQNVRGALSSVANLLPIFSKKNYLFDWLDRLFNKTASRQTSGYNIFCVK